ncbi:MAG: cell division protein ZapA [Synergistaceae bacterium]|nr:cell division protein ZapA [Synergistaceae bacterium]MBQ6435318.1 cell division protein ZapA [Synergistaceae bacterium]MBQ6737479.1 cell division protein ZapA [Synergistaceae bacterium]MBQ7068518.1 cell division protein ZapA [Synergistaceae bacterium]MBR0074550.1 cell division protein ZapA [Synergistaceae bacterium]
MNNSRDVFLTIGRNSYTIQTAIDNEDLDRIKTLIDEACGEITEGTKQEDMLMLTCLRLAYSLDSVNEKLKRILEKIDEA